MEVRGVGEGMGLWKKCNLTPALSLMAGKSMVGAMKQLSYLAQDKQQRELLQMLRKLQEKARVRNVV